MKKKQLIIAVIVVIAASAGAFYGGMQYARSKASPQGFQPGGNFPDAGDRQQRRMQGNGTNRGSGGPGGFAGGGDFVAGEIISKDDKSITVKTRDGGSKIVYFSDSTAIGKAEKGASSDLAMGQQVTIGGKGSDDGSFTAQNIQIRPDMPDQQNQ